MAVGYIPSFETSFYNGQTVNNCRSRQVLDEEWVDLFRFETTELRGDDVLIFHVKTSRTSQLNYATQALPTQSRIASPEPLVGFAIAIYAKLAKNRVLYTQTNRATEMFELTRP